ncbi:MAG: dihydrodipicolinate synthase family protein [Ignavibacteriae bacterium]|nr:dihydrodipicolinate synthase family protein [Ignavibacteriota bacterium]
MQVNWKGVYPAITTKFTADDNLDLELFSKNIEFQIEAGIDGIILAGSLGEASTLSDEEKFILVDVTKKVAGDKIPVILNIAEQSTKEAIRIAKEAEQKGVDGFMLLPPMRYAADSLETVEYFKAIAKSTTLSIMIYNNPIDYKIPVTLEMFEQLAELDNINAVKESTRDVTNVTRMINKFGKRFKILCGVDTIALECLALGADGWVGGLVCAFPKETVAIYRLTKSGRVDDAVKIARWFLPLLELDINPKLVQNIKLAETYTGIGSEYVRAPRLPLYGTEREKVKNIIETALENRPVLPEYLSIKIENN